MCYNFKLEIDEEKDMKKTLKLAGILCLVASIFNVASLMLDIFYYTFSVYYIVFDSICFVVSLLTGIIYLSLMNKSEDFILSRKGLFLTLMFLNIFNGLVVWIISFFVYFSITKKQRPANFSPFGNERGESKNETTDDSLVINLDEDSYKERKIVKDLTEKLEELIRLRDKKLISQEEYKKMREELIKKYIG